MAGGRQSGTCEVNGSELGERKWRCCGETKGKESETLSEFSVGVAPEENLSGPLTGEQEALNVTLFFFFFLQPVFGAQIEVLEAHDFLWCGAVTHSPGEEGAGPGVHHML